MTLLMFSLQVYSFLWLGLLNLQAPNYPHAGRCWEIVDKYKVTIFYTAPTLVRSLMRESDEASDNSDCSFCPWCDCISLQVCFRLYRTHGSILMLFSYCFSYCGRNLIFSVGHLVVGQVHKNILLWVAKFRRHSFWLSLHPPWSKRKPQA